MTGKELPITSFDDLASWEKWLRKHGATSSGLQLKFAKSGATKPTISKADAIEGALCHGWIDGQINKLDEHYYLTRFTPRRPGSRWSAINRKTAQRLMREGRMSEAGLREVERAKATGRWDTAYVSQSKAPPPADLKAALKANAAAKRAFDQLDSANRYAVIYRVQDVKKPETRARRITQYVDMLARGETIHPKRTRKD
jgi:uncharacterized protein YdeI (YjbR/CyaY-like superfamily)